MGSAWALSCAEAGNFFESVFSSHTLYRKTSPGFDPPAEFLSLSDHTDFPGQCLIGAGELPVKLFEDTLPGPGRLFSVGGGDPVIAIEVFEIGRAHV